MPTRNVIRLFISSTFLDFQAERQALHDVVFPRLRDLCIARNAEFHPIDLRWGVSAEASLDHKTVEICEREIDTCHRLTPRPNFLLMVGDRYGWQPLPRCIAAAEFDTLLGWLRQAGEDDTLLAEWYALDENAVPAEYVLRRRKGAMEADAAWAPVEHRLRGALQRAAQAVLPAEEREKYLLSVTHREILRGLIFGEDGAVGNAVIYRRHLMGSHAASLRDGTDEGRGGQLDEVHGALQNLRDRIELSAVVLPDGSLVDFYIPQFIESVGGRLEKLILEQLESTVAQAPEGLERWEHQTFAAQALSRYIPRPDVERQILETFGAQSISVALLGSSGSGKSSVLAAVGALVAANTPVNVVSRHVGATARSVTLSALLEDIAAELAEATGLQKPVLPRAPVELLQAWRRFLDDLPDFVPLLLVVDALDQLNVDDPAEAIDWLPFNRIPNLTILVSAAEGPVAEILRIVLPDSGIVDIRPVEPEQCSSILRHWLASTGRRLTPEQEKAVVEPSLSVDGRPLYLRVACEIARHWRHDHVPARLPDSIAGLIGELIRSLSEDRRHGRVLVRTALGMLACAREGLSERELLNLLDRTPAVLEEYRAAHPHAPALPTLPPIVWSRLSVDLDAFLAERIIDGVPLLGFFHRQFRSVIIDLLGEAERLDLHARMADYFADDDAQPLRPGVVLLSPPNRRRLAELPWHLMQAGENRADALRACLTDFEFLVARVGAGELDAHLGDLEMARLGDRTLPKLVGTIEETLRNHAFLLRRDPTDPWPADRVLIQLCCEFHSDHPLHALAAQMIKRRRIQWHWLRSLTSRPVMPGMVGLRLPEVKVTGIVPLGRDQSLALTAEGAAWIVDDRFGRPRRPLQHQNPAVADAVALTDGKIVTTGTDGCLRVWDRNSGRLLQVVQVFETACTAILAISGGRVATVAPGHGIAVWTPGQATIDCIAPQPDVAESLLPDKRIGRSRGFGSDDGLFTEVAPDMILASGPGGVMLLDGSRMKVQSVRLGAAIGWWRVDADTLMLTTVDGRDVLWDIVGNRTRIEAMARWRGGANALPDGRIFAWRIDEQAGAMDVWFRLADTRGPIEEGRFTAPWGPRSFFREASSTVRRSVSAFADGRIALTGDGRIDILAADRSGVETVFEDPEMKVDAAARTLTVTTLLSSSERQRAAAVRVFMRQGQFVPVSNCIALPSGDLLLSLGGSLGLLMSGNTLVGPMLDHYVPSIDAIEPLADGRFALICSDGSARFWSPEALLRSGEGAGLAETLASDGLTHVNRAVVLAPDIVAFTARNPRMSPGIDLRPTDSPKQVLARFKHVFGYSTIQPSNDPVHWQQDMTVSDGLLLSWGGDGKLRITVPRGPVLQYSLNAPAIAVMPFRWGLDPADLPSGLARRVAVLDGSGAMHLMDLPQGNVWLLPGMPADLRGQVDFRDGRLLAATSQQVKVWSVPVVGPPDAPSFVLSCDHPALRLDDAGRQRFHEVRLAGHGRIVFELGHPEDGEHHDTASRRTLWMIDLDGDGVPVRLPDMADSYGLWPLDADRLVVRSGQQLEVRAIPGGEVQAVGPLPGSQLVDAMLTKDGTLLTRDASHHQRYWRIDGNRLLPVSPSPLLSMEQGFTIRLGTDTHVEWSHSCGGQVLDTFADGVFPVLLEDGSVTSLRLYYGADPCDLGQAAGAPEAPRLEYGKAPEVVKATVIPLIERLVLAVRMPSAERDATLETILSERLRGVTDVPEIDVLLMLALAVKAWHRQNWQQVVDHVLAAAEKLACVADQEEPRLRRMTERLAICFGLPLLSSEAGIYLLEQVTGHPAVALFDGDSRGVLAEVVPWIEAGLACKEHPALVQLSATRLRAIAKIAQVVAPAPEWEARLAQAVAAEELLEQRPNAPDSAAEAAGAVDDTALFLDGVTIESLAVPETFADLKEEALAGSTDALRAIGGRFALGRDGAPQDFRMAATLYRIAADAGDAKAAMLISEMYRRGEGTPPSPTGTLRWLERAVELGNVGATTNLGIAYVRGELVPADFDRAIHYLRIGVRNRDVLALAALASLLALDGPHQDLDEAERLAIAAVAQGHSQCEALLAEIRERRRVGENSPERGGEALTDESAARYEAEIDAIHAAVRGGADLGDCLARIDRLLAEHVPTATLRGKLLNTDLHSLRASVLIWMERHIEACDSARRALDGTLELERGGFGNAVRQIVVRTTVLVQALSKAKRPRELIELVATLWPSIQRAAATAPDAVDGDDIVAIAYARALALDEVDDPIAAARSWRDPLSVIETVAEARNVAAPVLLHAKMMLHHLLLMDRFALAAEALPQMERALEFHISHLPVVMAANPHDWPLVLLRTLLARLCTAKGPAVAHDAAARIEEMLSRCGVDLVAGAVAEPALRGLLEVRILLLHDVGALEEAKALLARCWKALPEKAQATPDQRWLVAFLIGEELHLEMPDALTAEDVRRYNDFLCDIVMDAVGHGGRDVGLAEQILSAVTRLIGVAAVKSEHAVIRDIADMVLACFTLAGADATIKASSNLNDFLAKYSGFTQASASISTMVRTAVLDLVDPAEQADVKAILGWVSAEERDRAIANAWQLMRETDS